MASPLGHAVSTSVRAGSKRFCLRFRLLSFVWFAIQLRRLTSQVSTLHCSRAALVASQEQTFGALSTGSGKARSRWSSSV